MLRVLKVLTTLSFIAFAIASPYKTTHAENGEAIEQSGDYESDVNENSFNGTTQTPFVDESSLDQEDRKSGDEAIIELFTNEHQKHPEKEKQPFRQQDSATKSTAAQHQHQQQQTKAKQSNLNEDVNDFIELIPKAEIKSKIEEYYKNDMDVQHIFEYVHGKEFQELRRNILDMADVKDILQYLNRNGLNVKGVIRKVDNRLGISKIRPNSLTYTSAMPFATNTTIGGLNGLIEDVLALLPQDEIFIMFFEKLDNSPKFASFIRSIGDSDFHRKYNSLWKSKELHLAALQLKKHKVDMIKIIQILQGYFIFGTF